MNVNILKIGLIESLPRVCKSKFCHYSFVLAKTFILINIFFILTCCSDNKMPEEYPVIDLVGSVENYQKVYFSDYFSSIELIPLETREECLLIPSPSILAKDSFIIFRQNNGNYVFNASGKFLYELGKKGQGPNEYLNSSRLFLNYEKPVIYIEDFRKILEFDFSGNFIHSFLKPVMEDVPLTDCSYVEDDLFVGQIYYNGKRMNKYALFNSNGDIIKYFPSYIFYNEERRGASLFSKALDHIHVDDRLYLKDYVNDTVYLLENSNLQSAYVFGFGKYSFPVEHLEFRNIKVDISESFNIFFMMGTPKFFFYQVTFPKSLPKPKAKLRYSLLDNEYRSSDGAVYGLYNIAENTNILLDTDEYLQKGIINDINGGLPFIPRYYAGDGVVVDVWNVEDMKEMLTEEYFASKTIKDQQAHQKLKEILKNLKDDDNPVVVVAKMK